MHSPELKKPKILFVATHVTLGGAETNLLTIFDNRARGDFDIAGVVVPKRGWLVDQLLYRGLEVYDVTYRHFRRRNPFGYFLTIFSLVKIIKNSKANIVHLNNYGLIKFWSQACNICRIPLVCHVRGVVPEDFRRLYVYFDRAKAVVAVSRAVEKSLRESGVTSPIQIIYDGVDCEKFSSNSIAEIKRNENFRIAVFSQLIPAKGVEFLLRAVQNLAPTLSFNLFIAGEDPVCSGYDRYLVDLTNQLGLSNQVCFLGRIDDVLPVMQEADLVILASMMEACPNSVLEALACQKLVLASRVGGVPEIIQDSYNGLLFEAGNVNELSQKIMQAFQMSAQERKHILLQARQTAVNKFEISRQVNQLSGLYHNILGGNYESFNA